MKYTELLARQKEIKSLRDLICSTIITHRKHCERGIVFPPDTLKSLYHALEIVDDMMMFEREYPIEVVREYKTLVKHIHMMIQVKGGVVNMLSQVSIDAKLKQWEGLVHKVVLKHFNKHNTQYKEYDELINIGLFGLYNAIITYDKDRGASEMSYYYRCIYNEILKVQNYHLNDRRNTKGRTVSIDAYKDANGDSSLESQEWFTSPSQSDGLALESGLREIINTLDETNKNIVSKLELGFTCEEIAHEMGVSRQAIHQRVQNIRKIIDKKWLKFA